MSFILWIIIGLAAGAIAHRVMDSRGGFFGSLVVGLVGALLGGKLADIFKLHVAGGLADQFIIATLGAILFLFLWKKLF